MSTVVKDLGAVSAYAYAVEKGYTGTEAEFAELMADYAEVGQRAEDAAESALNSKTAAQTAATTATNKASEATTAAQTATTKAQEAVANAEAAARDASQAMAAESMATAKASEATTAAAAATTAKDDAVSAKTAAETAQGKAEDAQAAAESVAESIPSDYSQLSEDVSDLKEGLSDIAVELIPTNYGSVSTENLIIGTSGLSGKVTASDTDDGVSLINTAGVNGTVGFELAELPYGSSIPLDFFVTVTNAVSPIFIDIRHSVTSERTGVVISSLALSDGVYKLENWIPSTFDHDTYGNIFLGYNLRYNQRSPVEITLSVKQHGAVQKTVIKNSALENIDYDNLSSELKDAITIVSGKNPTEYGGKHICTFNKGVAIGDSLTAGVFNYSGGATTITNFSFPAKIGQLTGIDMTNLGNGGKTSADWYALHSADDLSGYQFAIIQLGVNDAMQYNGWTQDSIDAFTNIINKLLEENNGIFVFVSTIIPATSYMGEKYNAVSEGIRNLVETLNNNHVILLDMAQYAHMGDAVGYNNGHLSALGYERLALDYISYISYVISQNLTLFRNIQFIGTNYIYP
jgi:hypothetical protein